MQHLLRSVSLATMLFCSLGTAEDRVIFDNAKNGEEAIQGRYWVGIIGSAASCVTTIRLDTITSVSKHTYTVDGLTFREVTIDTQGNNSIRFYACINERVNTMKDRLSNTRAIIDSKSGGSTNYPGKKFPEGTYSHNVEYRLENEADLNKLYNSVVNALFKNKGCTFKI